MGKRQQRYFQSKIVVSTPQLLGRNANIILITNVVHGGIIVKIDAQKVLIKDYGNHQLTFPIEHILEIIIDHVAEY